MRARLLVSELFWRERAQWFRCELGDLEAAHRCELRADAIYETGGHPPTVLRGYEPDGVTPP